MGDSRKCLAPRERTADFSIQQFRVEIMNRTDEDMDRDCRFPRGKRKMIDDVVYNVKCKYKAQTAKHDKCG